MDRWIVVLTLILATAMSARSADSRQPLAFGSVEVGGELHTRLEKNFERLHSDRYQESNLFTKTADAKWPGDYEGRTALGLVLDARALGIEETGIDSLVNAYSKYYNKLGYFGKINLPEKVDEQQLSGHGWTLRALCEYYLWRQKPETLKQIQTMVDNLILPTKGLHADYPLDPAGRANKGGASGEIVATVGKWVLSSDIGCDFIFFDGVVQTYAVTRDARLVPVIEELVDLFNRMDARAIQAQTHATLSGTRAMIRYYKLCGKPAVLQKAKETFDIYLSEGCSENYENYNWFGRPAATEPCAIVDSFLVANQLWQHTGAPRYLEAAQLIYFNGLGATQRSNGGFGLDNCSGAGNPFLHTRVTEAFWCCSMRGAEGLSAAARYSAFTDAGGIWLVQYMNSHIRVAIDDSTLELAQTSGYPLEGGTEVTVKQAPEKPCEIRFFVPAWIKPGAIVVNGAKAATTSEGGFLVVSRQWKPGDKIRFDFDLKLERVPTRNIYSLEGFELIRNGPLFLAATSEQQPKNKNAAPEGMKLGGELVNMGNGKARLGETELTPVYHLLESRYDQTQGSWRQMLFPNHDGQVAK